MVGHGKGVEEKTFQEEEGVAGKNADTALLNFYNTLLHVSIHFAKLTAARLQIKQKTKCTCLVMHVNAIK